MKRNLAAAGMLLALCALARAQNSANRVVIPARDTGTPRVIEVSLLHASITVRTHSGKDVIVETPGAGPAPAERDGMRRIDAPLLAGITVGEQENVLRIHVPFHNGHQRDLALSVPVDTSLNLKTIHGDVRVEGVHGEIDVTTLHGNVTLTAVSGTVVASSTLGTLKVSMEGLDPAKPLSFSSLNGDIDVTFPADVKANLKLKADRGEIWSDFDIVLTGTGMGARSHTTNGVYRITMDRNIYGTINGGGVEAGFHTVNGKILIHKRSK
jgi:hypothetical protein